MLKDMRTGKNMTQEDLATLLNVDRSAVARWESGGAKPCRKHRRALCSIFHCTEAELFPPAE